MRAALTGLAKPSLVFQAVRTTDMVYLGFEFYNAKAVVTAGQTEIVAEDTKLPMYMVVVFPSQHLGEQWVAYSTSMTTWPTPPLNGALAGFSWLAFELAGTAKVPYTMAGLLDWSKAKPELVPVATSVRCAGCARPAPHRARDPLAAVAHAARNGTWHHSASPVTFSSSPSSGIPASGRRRSSPPWSPRCSRPSGPRATARLWRPPPTRGSCRSTPATVTTSWR